MTQMSRNKRPALPRSVSSSACSASSADRVPLLPHALVVEQLQEHAAHHRARLKACLRRVMCPAAVSQTGTLSARDADVAEQKSCSFPLSLLICAFCVICL